MFCGKQIAERVPHGFQVGTGAMDHHDGRPGRVARPDVDDIEDGAGNLDRLALRRIGALQEEHAGLRDQRQHRQHRHDRD